MNGELMPGTALEVIEPTKLRLGDSIVICSGVVTVTLVTHEMIPDKLGNFNVLKHVTADTVSDDGKYKSREHFAPDDGVIRVVRNAVQ